MSSPPEHETLIAAFVDLYIKDMGLVPFREENLPFHLKVELAKVMQVTGVDMNTLSIRILDILSKDEESIIEVIIDGNKVKGKLRTIRKLLTY